MTRRSLSSCPAPCRENRWVSLTVLLLLSVASSGCQAPHAYVSGLVSEPVFDVPTRGGRVERIARPDCIGGSAIVGMAYWRDRDLLYARITPGNRVIEFNRAGRCLRTQIPQPGVPSPVPAGCGSALEQLTCGLTIRWSDGHLFLDDPNPVNRRIFELDNDGALVQTITYQSPNPNVVSPISGLGFHQSDGRLWALFPNFQTDSAVVEYDLAGRALRRFSVGNAGVQAQGLAIDTERNEAVLPRRDGQAIVVFDLQGNRLRDVAVPRAVAGFLGGGIGAGPRRARLLFRP